MKTGILSAPYIMWLIIIIGIGFNVFMLPYTFLFEASLWSFIFFFVTFVYWMYFFIKAITINPEGPHRPSHISHLITTGVYESIRHPMYSADLILAWGIVVVYPLVSVLFSVVWLTIVMIIWSYIEEAALIKKFGEEYISYQKKTPMFIPRKNK